MTRVSLRTRLWLLQLCSLIGLLALVGCLLAGDWESSPRTQLVAGIALTVLICGTLATWMLLHRLAGLLASIAATCDRVTATGDVNVKLTSPERGEIGRLSQSFNRMLNRVRVLLEAQRQLLADTSHELRNPLTVIRTNLDLLKRDLDPRTRQEAATETEQEAERMSRLVTDLLLLARQDATAHRDLVPIRLDALAHDAVERFRQLAPDHSVASGQVDGIVLYGDPDRLRELLDNLLDNAVRYTPAGGKVTVSVSRAGSSAQLIVDDTGVGIPPEHLERIFDRFYRVDPARSRATGGTGLGLAIVKHVAESLGGRVHAESKPGRGSRFVVTLPAEPSWSGDTDTGTSVAQVEAPVGKGPMNAGVRAEGTLSGNLSARPRVEGTVEPREARDVQR